MRFREKRKKDIQLDITPIVDMVFNLLIFFALSINFSAAASIDLVLPKTSFPVPAPQVPIIQIDRKLEISIDRAVIQYDGLPGALAGLSAGSDSKAIIIMADEMVHHGYVVSVMDICKQAGFEKISISASIEQ
jgi:biopolymer transport protein ExbD